jgi:hypothetical protein
VPATYSPIAKRGRGGGDMQITTADTNVSVGGEWTKLRSVFTVPRCFVMFYVPVSLTVRFYIKNKMMSLVVNVRGIEFHPCFYFVLLGCYEVR